MSDVKIEHVEPLDLAAGYAVQRVEELEAALAQAKTDRQQCWKAQEKLLAALAQKDAEIARLREALTPSGETKAAYMGEFGFSVLDEDEDGYECVRIVEVPWTTIKEIMAAIVERAALTHYRGER